MSSKVTLVDPPFHFPLSDDDILLMGKISIVWGQIDEALNSILRWTLNLNGDVFDSLLGNQMIGTRVSHLTPISDTCTRPVVRALVREASESLKNVIVRRNLAMHGCWGYYVQDPTYKNLRAGAFNHQKPNARFFADELPGLFNDLCKCLDILYQLKVLAVEESPEPVEFVKKKIYFAPQPPDARSAPLRFERGDQVVRVESKSRGWTDS